MARLHKNILIVAASTALFFVFIVAFVLFERSRLNPFPQLVYNYTSNRERVAFPEVDYFGLSDEQIKVLDVLKREYELQPPGIKYSEGVEEPWCADFVSWVFKEARVPLKNPNSGSWRIPGTYTLREYYKSEGRFVAAGSNYNPKIGDVMIYDNPSTFGQHVNIVIKNEDSVITTIGGNEGGSIRIVKHPETENRGFIGYGLF